MGGRGGAPPHKPLNRLDVLDCWITTSWADATRRPSSGAGSRVSAWFREDDDARRDPRREELSRVAGRGPGPRRKDLGGPRGKREDDAAPARTPPREEGAAGLLHGRACPQRGGRHAPACAAGPLGRAA